MRATPLHAIRAVIFARNTLCDLAQREASAAFDAPNTKRLRAPTGALHSGLQSGSPAPRALLWVGLAT